jgi:hypothetical protein
MTTTDTTAPAGMDADDAVDDLSGGIRSFDHSALVQLREYRQLLRCAAAFARAPHGLTPEAAIAAVRDAVAAMTYLLAPCTRCSVEARPRFAAPYAVEMLDDTRVRAAYRCASCGTAWRAEFAADPETTG